MNIKIVIGKNAGKTIKLIQKNYKTLTQDKEISLYFFGEQKYNDGTLNINIESAYMPRQETGAVSVDISESDHLEMIREIGPEQNNKLIGQWHFHPFGTGSPSWSGTDEEHQKAFSDPKKSRYIFNYFLSNGDQTIARTIINTQMKIGSIIENIEQEIRFNIQNEGIIWESDDESNEIRKLSEEIKVKTRETPKYEYYPKTQTTKKEEYEYLKKWKTEEDFKIENLGNDIKITFSGEKELRKSRLGMIKEYMNEERMYSISNTKKTDSITIEIGEGEIPEVLKYEIENFVYKMIEEGELINCGYTTRD